MTTKIVGSTDAPLRLKKAITFFNGVIDKLIQNRSGDEAAQKLFETLKTTEDFDLVGVRIVLLALGPSIYRLLLHNT
jgi:hypothetical protein